MTSAAPPTRVTLRGGVQHMPARVRIGWFRADHPDWCIETAATHLDMTEGVVVMAARVRTAEGLLIATGHKSETRAGFSDWIEKAETGAIARALVMAGYVVDEAVDLGDAATPATAGDPWLRRIHALGAERGWTHEDLHDWAVRLYSVASLTELSSQQRSAFVTRIEKVDPIV